MSSTARPTSYAPRTFASGTFPVPKDYSMRQMLYNCKDRHAASTEGPPDQVIPSFPFCDVPVYADTVDLQTLGFHKVWGCMLTPDNVAARIATDDLRYHVWVATNRVLESKRIKLTERKALICAVTDQFMLELGLVLLDLIPGPLVLFVDPRLQDNTDKLVARARTLVAKFDEAQVRRWRIIVTLPATDDGICAAWELTNKYDIQTHLTLVSCLPHAMGCIEAGATMVSMSVESVIDWFDQQRGRRALSPDHPGIEEIQACATYIRHHGINTTLLTNDVRNWNELELLNGIGATALRQTQLDEIPMQKLTTWLPRWKVPSLATRRALEADFPSNYLSSEKSFLGSLPAETLSFITAVLYVRLNRWAAQMDTIEQVVRYEIDKRLKLDAIPMDQPFVRPPAPPIYEVLGITPSSRRSMSAARGKASSSKQSRSRSRSRSRRDSRQENVPEQKAADPNKMVEDVDYF